jgi:hypothetical protein
MSGIDRINAQVQAIFAKNAQDVPTALDIARRDFLLEWYRAVEHMTDAEMRDYRHDLNRRMKHFARRQREARS